MGKEKDGQLSNNSVDNSLITKPYIILTLLLFFNIIFIIVILILSILWANSRNINEMILMPAPNEDRSICALSEDKKEKCVQPETYFLEKLDKNIRKSQMQYMAGKLNYANVVCRKTKPAVYLFRYQKSSVKGTVIWEGSTDKNTHRNSIKYDISTGFLKILKTGTFFVHSQITEAVENSIHNGTYLNIILESKGKKEKILESISGECNMVNAISKRSHYVGSTFQLMTGDFLFASHSHPSKILKFDSFLGIRELG